jgi:hypothetical protein
MGMTAPITAAVILGLVAQKFIEGAVGKTAEKLVEQLWTTIVARFQGRKKTEENLAAIVTSQGKDSDALVKVEKVLDAEFVEDEAFQQELQGLAQQIITIQNQVQSQATNTFTSQDQSQMRAVGQVYGTANLGDQKS